MLNTFPNLKILEKKVWQGTEKYNFNARLEEGLLETYEKAYGFVLPESYKQFMERFNGGMLLEHSQSFYIDMLEWEPDGQKWSSFYFYKLDEMIEKFRDQRLDNFLVGIDFSGNYPIIPICRMPGWESNGFLFLFSNKGIEKESPVFLAGENVCGKISDNFHEFIGWLLEYEGFPPVEKVLHTTSCIDFMKENKIRKIATSETFEEEIERHAAYLSLFPNDEWTYCERGNSYVYKGMPQEALDDFNKAIDIDNKNAFFYHCRGDLLLKHASPRKALIDMDIAVKLEPENKMFLTGRADALVKLGKLKKALIDCNKVLGMDANFRLALYTRKDIYEALGEDEKAKVDADLLDNLD